MTSIPLGTICANPECGHDLDHHVPVNVIDQSVTEEKLAQAPEGRYGCDYADPFDVTHAVCQCLKFVPPPRNQPVVQPPPEVNLTPGPDYQDAELRRVTVSELGLDENVVLVLWWSGRVTWTTK